MKRKFSVLKGLDHFSGGFEFDIFKNQQTANMNLHTHDFNELVFVIEGFGYHKTFKGKRNIKRGDMFFIPDGGAHGYETEKGMQIYNILFSGKMAKDIQKNYLQKVFRGGKGFTDVLDEKLNMPVHLPPAETVYIERLIKKICGEYIGKKLGYETVTKTYFAELLIHLARYLEKESGVKMSHVENDERIKKILEHIEKRYAAKITLKELADRVNLVPAYFSAFFKETTGYGVFEYITEFRIYKACSLLKTTDKHILEIAYETGYNSLSLFNRIFKRLTGLSPRKYRHLRKI